VAGERTGQRFVHFHHAERHARGTPPATRCAVRGRSEEAGCLGRAWYRHAQGARHDDHALHGEGDREVEQDRGVAEAGAAMAAGQVVE
jgi:hypothetical protein